jgi:O-antigen/teichoic acid export membrane protein
MTGPDPQPTAPPQSHGTETRAHIRGSVALASGRFISLGLNFAGQILIVRYLSREAYGSYTFALSMATTASIVSAFGIDTAFSRFIPIYREAKDYPRLFGSMVFMFALVCGLGLVIAVGMYGLRGYVEATLVTDPLSMALLLLLLLFIPMNALDRVFDAGVAVMGSPWSIFLRRHVLGPGLKFAAIITVILCRGTVQAMAIGFLIATALGLITYGGLFLHALRIQGLTSRFSFAHLTVSPRRLLRFSLPMLGADLGGVLRYALVVFLLEIMRGSGSVAAFGAVVSLAELNKLVLRSFGFLFIPIASRCFSRGQTERIGELYWQSSVWIALLTLPLFLVSFGLARPVTILLYGAEYAESGIILSLLSLGYYVHAVLGFNAATLKVYGKARQILWTEVLGTGATMVLCILLIPAYGGSGAAAAVCASTIFHNVIIQIAVARATDVEAFRSSLLGLWISVLVGALALLGFQYYTSPPLIVGFGAAAALSLLILRTQSRLLAAEKSFPELERVPLVHFSKILLGTRRERRR